MQNIRWAVLGTGVIANEMAVALKKNGRNIDAVGNRTHEKAVAFAEKYGIKKVYDNYNDMFTDPDIDVIYITTPHNTHINFMRRAIENGKHILVEKSITLNSRELDEAIALADKKGVVIGEAMTIYHMPIYKKLKEILESGKLGKVNLITMNFGSFKEYDTPHSLLVKLLIRDIIRRIQPFIRIKRISHHLVSSPFFPDSYDGTFRCCIFCSSSINVSTSLNSRYTDANRT